MPADPSGTSELDAASCWSRLGDSGIGRLAVTADDGPWVTPIDYLVHDGRLYFRSSPGTKLQALAHTPAVALEVEGRSGHTLWTVVVRGSARRLDRDDEIEASGVLAVHPTAGGARDNFVCIDPETVTGRRILPQPAG